jgi:glycosyltransferase involved in cell wall biosynthesis
MKLAVLIPVYNAAATLQDTLDSLQRIESGWEQVEKVIFCDDASTDNSLALLENFAFDRCPVLILRHESNKGEAAAYSTMLSHVSPETEWFLILHADDLALPNFISRNLEILNLCDDTVASVSSNYWVFDGTAESIAAKEEDIVFFRTGTPENIRHTATVGCWWHISGALVNKAKWLEFGGRDARYPYSGDWDLTMRWQLRGYTVGHSPVATTKYRQAHATSVSGNVYLRCSDFKERTSVALGLPEIFYGAVLRKHALSILFGAWRRAARFMVDGKVALSANAVRVGTGSFLKLFQSGG